jgi:PAS domain S-box-containing protein
LGLDPGRRFPRPAFKYRPSWPISRAEGPALLRTDTTLPTPISRINEPASREALTTLLDASPLAIAVLDLEGNVCSWNAAAEAMFGWAAADIIGRPYPLFQPGSGDDFRALRDRALAEGSVRIPECRRPRKDGSLLDARASAGLVRDARGSVTGLLAIAEDVTDRKSVEAERDHWFHESQQLLAVCGPDGTIQRVNDAWRRLLRYAPDDLIGRRLIELVHPGDRPGTQLHLQNLEYDRATSFENRCASADGGYRWFLWRSTSGEGDGFYAYGTDITDRKAFEQELWDAHAETERLLASISSILIRVDRQGLITRWNSAAQETFGLDSLAAIGRPFTECAGWADQKRAETIVAPRQEPYRVEDLRFAGLDGRDHFVTLTVTPLQRGSGGDGFLVLGADVTEHKILEDQLRQAQKLEAIGQLAAGIAHEINTPTQYVGDNARFLQDAFRDLGGLLDCVVRLRAAVAQQQPIDPSLLDELGREADRADIGFLRTEIPLAIAQSLEGVQRVSRIVGAMKEFSHPSEAKVAVDLNRAIETTMIVAQNELKYVADTRTNLDPKMPFVPCLPGEVNQVILNLLINAAHAIADVVRDEPGTKGLITVSTHRVDDWAEIRIADTGTGIAEKAQRRVFDPFFTTKEVGRGTGQGLALAHAVIVKKHRGHIWFETTVGRGTTFFVRLPLVAETEPPAC